MRLPLENDDESPDRDRAGEQRALIGLSLVDGVGPQRLRALLATFDTPSDVFRASRSALTKVDGVGDQTAEVILTFDDRAAVEQEMERADELGATLVSRWNKTERCSPCRAPSRRTPAGAQTASSSGATRSW